MGNPKVNVLIANYNYDKYIIDAIDSTLEQTYPDISLTIVDSGSTDNSWQKVYKHIFQSRPTNKILPSEFDIRTCLVNKNNRDIPVTAIRLNEQQGPSVARNIGLSMSLDKSDFIMILDADDMMFKNKVLRCVEEAMTLPSIIGIVYGDYDTLNVENGLVRTEYKHSFDANLLNRECIVHSGSLISKEALLSVQQPFGFYKPYLRVCEDYDLWLRITKKYLAYHIPETLSTVRVTPQNSTNQVSKDIWNQCSYIVYKENGLA